MKAFANFFPVVLVLSLLMATPANALVDEDPPYLTSATPALDPVVVTEDLFTEAEIDIVVGDDVSGVAEGELLLQFDGETIIRAPFDDRDLEEGTYNDGTFRVALDIQRSAPSGSYTIGARLRDLSGKESETFLNGTTLTIQNSRPGDLSPPVINDIRIQPSTLDLSGGAASAEVIFEILEDQSYVGGLNFALTHESPMLPADKIERYVTLVATGGRQTTVPIRIDFGPYARAGSYAFEFKRLFDGFFREADVEAVNSAFSTALTVVNPNSDSEPPLVERFSLLREAGDTNLTDVYVPFEVEFTDPLSGVDYLILEFTLPGAGQSISQFLPIEEVAGGDVRDGIFYGIASIPQFSSPGTYEITLHVGDAVGNVRSLGYGQDEALPSESDSSLQITRNGGVDGEDPKIVDIVLSTETVDVTNQDQEIVVTVEFTDNLSGLASFELDLRPVGGFPKVLRLNPANHLIAGTELAGTLQGSFVFLAGSTPGQWEFSDLELEDNVGNDLDTFSPAEIAPSLPEEITVISSPVEDLEPPQLVEFEILEDEPADVTDAFARVLARAVFTDDASGLDSARLTFKSPDPAHTDLVFSYNASWDDIIREGNQFIYEDYIFIKEGTVPGDYVLSDVVLLDATSKERRYGQFGEPFPPNIETVVKVANTGGIDELGPELTGIRFSSNSVDVSGGPRYIMVELDFTEDVTGLVQVNASLNESLFGTITRFFRGFNDLPYKTGDELGGTIQFPARFFPGLGAGTYFPKIELSDNYGRFATYFGEDSSWPAGEANTLEIIDTNSEDETPPVLNSLEVVGQADVTHGSAAVTIRAVLTDDLSGVESFRIRLESPSRLYSEFISMGPGDLLEGSYLGGTYESILTFDGFVEPGDWSMEVIARDFSGRGTTLDSDDLIIAGFPGTVPVMNRGPVPYPFATSLSFPDGWRNLEWFGWLRDAETFPYVLHAEHGWLYALEAPGNGFWFFDYGTQLWWAGYEEFYPFVYIYGENPRWLYYYAPFGAPGNRWFYDFGDGTDKRESEIGAG